jgi:hypothetical protein
VAVDSGAGDAEFGGDLVDGSLTSLGMAVATTRVADRVLYGTSLPDLGAMEIGLGGLALQRVLRA